jgi:hypothetical protein
MSTGPIQRTPNAGSRTAAGMDCRSLCVGKIVAVVRAVHVVTRGSGAHAEFMALVQTPIAVPPEYLSLTFPTSASLAI